MLSRLAPNSLAQAVFQLELPRIGTIGLILCLLTYFSIDGVSSYLGLKGVFNFMYILACHGTCVEIRHQRARLGWSFFPLCLRQGPCCLPPCMPGWLAHGLMEILLSLLPISPCEHCAQPFRFQGSECRSYFLFCSWNRVFSRSQIYEWYLRFIHLSCWRMDPGLQVYQAILYQ